ncbi:unnamed protein product [Bursaphelenchus okinawaensis]|uniref:Ground-like domain-containing protein n=1 Tax=Bursaphelenchus okinawaensis TaxID=465554 RepID=A0A811LRK2_9BILA|nr:unnamed protein product [Bursaphelenchus okinawaensis]CAG9126761.1 unnamed protein product [Bursaphelenchus okinawaensis]
MKRKTVNLILMTMSVNVMSITANRIMIKLVILCLCVWIVNGKIEEDDDDDNGRNGFLAFHTFKPLWDTPAVDTTTKKEKTEDKKVKSKDKNDKKSETEDDDSESNSDKDQFVSNSDFLSEFNQPNFNTFNQNPFPQSALTAFSLCPPYPPCMLPPRPCGCQSQPPPPPRCPPRMCPPPPLCPPPPPPVFCPPPTPCLPRQCPPQPPLPPPPPPMPALPCPCMPQTYTPPNDCCANCHRPCKMRRSTFLLAMKGSRTLTPELEQRTAMCNNFKLRDIIRENISPDIDESKRLIQFQAEQKFGMSVNVICGRGEFSFTIHTNDYCQYSFYDISCYAYK